MNKKTIQSTFKCIFSEHDYEPVRAKNKQESLYTCVYPNENKESTKIDGCDIIHRCTRCYKEKSVKSSISMAKEEYIKICFEACKENV